MKRFVRAIAVAMALFGVLGLARAGVIDPTQPVAGISQQVLGDQFWQWALQIEANTNPILDPDGRFAHVNNNGPVFFIAGIGGGTGSTLSGTRTFGVPAGRPVFFPMLNAFDAEIPGAGCDFACASGFLTFVNNAQRVYARLDGVDLLGGRDFRDFRQTSPAFFTVDLPASLSQALGLPPEYVGVLDVISDGFWVGLEGLTPGQYTLEFGGEFPDFPFSLAMTVNLQVVPEPGTLGLFLLGTLAAVGGVSRSRRSTARMNSIPAPAPH